VILTFLNLLSFFVSATATMTPMGAIRLIREFPLNPFPFVLDV